MILRHQFKPLRSGIARTLARAYFMETLQHTSVKTHTERSRPHLNSSISSNRTTQYAHPLLNADLINHLRGQSYKPRTFYFARGKKKVETKAKFLAVHIHTSTVHPPNLIPRMTLSGTADTTRGCISRI